LGLDKISVMCYNIPMKKIIYREEPMKKFSLWKTEQESDDFETELKQLQKDHPTWDIFFVDDNGELDFIIKKDKSENATNA
jgi:hypothetical protein